MMRAATVEDRLWLPVPELSAAGGVRRSAVALGEEAGFEAGPLANLAIVATELATNVARHADDGRVLLRLRRDGERMGVELVAIDRGPGMSDIVAASRDGHSTTGTLGVGLGAIIRLADEFDAYSLPGSGTVLAVTLWMAGSAARGVLSNAWAAGLSRPIEGELVCGDAYAAREVDGRRQILLCDGLGHGPLAASAAQAVIAEFTTAPVGGPKDVLDHIHQRTRHTRGTVAGIAELDPVGAVVRFAGIGNITAVIIAGSGERRTFVSLPGVLGQQRRESREFDYPMPKDGLIILHSDGLTDRWNLADYPGLRDHTPLVIAATLLRDAARRRDDAAVLVARAS
jgi:anti-sigma regulatory factor (Ser/Thr protein kinase)